MSERTVETIISTKPGLTHDQRDALTVLIKSLGSGQIYALCGFVETDFKDDLEGRVELFMGMLH